MANVIYAGSFDPFTNGHLSIIKKASKIFSTVYVAIANNSNKTRRYSIFLIIQRVYIDLLLMKIQK